MAPLVTCACLLDLYSSTGCDFIRMDIGFTPVNDVWSDSYAQLGLFSFDSDQTDTNKWKRTFNDGCQSYSANFESIFIASDQGWYISRIMAYISGISSLVALATAWLLTITPLPASFFWPGVLLPAVVLSMLTGAAKFLFFDTQICTEPLWFVDESSPAVAAQSCEIGESSVFGIASVAAYFLCTVLICFRSPQKRTLDENFGKRVGYPGSTITHHTGTDIICNDPEQGHAGEVINTLVAVSGRGTLGMEKKESMTNHDSQETMIIKNTEHGNHTRSTSDVTWGTGSNKNTRNLGVLSHPTKPPPDEKGSASTDVEWNTYGRPIVVTINDNGPLGGPSYSDGSTTQSSSKSPGSRGTPNNKMLPPRHNGKSTIMRPTNNINNNNSSNNSNNRTDYDAGSVGSRISKLSLTDTQTSDEMSALGMQSYSVAPSVVAIPRRSRHGFSPGSSHSSGRKSRYKRASREDRNDVFLNEQLYHPLSNGSRLDANREMVELGPYLPPLDEMSTTRSLDRSLEDHADHGDLINKCVRDLQLSFDDNGFRTM